MSAALKRGLNAALLGSAVIIVFFSGVDKQGMRHERRLHTRVSFFKWTTLNA